MQQVNGVPVLSSDPSLLYSGLEEEPTWFSAQGGVYKCFERTTQQQVAIKKYLVEEDNPYEDMFVMPKELVENEIYSMTKCVHPNVLKLYAVHLHLEFVYLIMPLCTGGSLQHYVFEHHLTVGQLVYIITSIASGLAKVHGHGYIHRDIKCDNIFLDEHDNSIVIGDFGVVSILPAADSSVEEAGVVLFWSPELVQQKIINHKVDIWALGIVILEILNGGKAPYEDEKLDEEEIKQRILKIGRPEYPPDLPSRLVDLLDHCLDPDPRARYSANHILQHPFLKDYESELLFPANRLDQEISSQSESDPSEIMEQKIIPPSKHSLEAMDMSEETTQEDSIMIEEKTIPPLPAKCRLPLPAFSVDKSVSAAIPVKEKIANVIRKRQSMSDSNRSQGSRIPMLCILQPLVEEPPKADPLPKLRSVKSVRLSTAAATPPSQQRSLSGGTNQQASALRKQQLTRSNTIPSRIDQTLRSSNARQIRPPSTTLSTTEKKRVSSARSPIPGVKTRKPLPNNAPNPTTTTATKLKRELPPKSSVYRHKRLPAGESRTARLMMGISTNGRRQSFRQQEEGAVVEELSPTLGHRFGKLFNNSKPKEPSTTFNKRRPMSFAASSLSSLHKSDTSTSSLPSFNRSIPNMPISEKHLKRHSVPVKSLDTNNKKKLNDNDASMDKENTSTSLKSNSIKALRVH